MIKAGWEPFCKVDICGRACGLLVRNEGLCSFHWLTKIDTRKDRGKEFK